MKTVYRDNVKRMLNLLISAVFYFFLKIWGAISRLCGKREDGYCVVLYYHSIRNEERAKFARQMDMLNQLSKPIRADASDTLRQGVKYSAITFDDGLQNVIENALPELKKRDIPFTIFVIAEGFGKLLDWSDEFLECYRSERIITEDQMKKLPSDLVTIGSHTLTHSRLPSVGEKEAKIEIRESRSRLQKIINKEVELFSFPFGAFNEKLIDLCREAGYKRIFTTLPYPAFSDPKEFVTGRVTASPTDWSLEFRLKLLGAYQWLPYAISLKRKLRQIF